MVALHVRFLLELFKLKNMAQQLKYHIYIFAYLISINNLRLKLNQNIREISTNYKNKN